MAMAGSNKFFAAKPISLARLYSHLFQGRRFFETCLVKDPQYLGADKEIAAGAAQI
jgi:hypothetical protein